MDIHIVSDELTAVRAEAMVIPVFTDAVLDDAVQLLDASLNGIIANVLAFKEITGAFGETSMLHTFGLPFRRVFIIGLGERTKFEPYLLARYAGIAVRVLGRKNVTEIAFVLPAQVQGSAYEAVSFLTEGSVTGSFETTWYQSKPEKSIAVKTVSIVGASSADRSEFERGLERGKVLGKAINFARRLAVTPANDMTPTHLAQEATKAASEIGLEVDIVDETRARKEGMGLFLSVAQGSAQPPKMIVLTYRGDPSSNEVLALVGKGITFDSGGIDIKPVAGMEDMKYDMSGGAATIATLYAIGKLRPRLNVIGVVPATENMPGGKATKPGDIVRAMNGTTVEILNTDAEGRLVLADGLCYAKKLGATKIIDSATLTSGCFVALGQIAGGAMGNDERFIADFLAAAKGTGERFWQLPLFDEYEKDVKSIIADVKNIGGKGAVPPMGGMFLKVFVGDTPWIHLDLGTSAFTDDESAWQAKGPTGTPIRSLFSMIETLAGSKLPVGAGT